MKKLFKKYPEIVTIPIAIILWVFSIPTLRFLDPTAGIFDSGVFQILLFSIIQTFVYLSVAWLIIRLLFGTVYRYLINEMKSNFGQLTAWEKLRLSYSIYFAVLLALIALSFTL